MKSAILLLILSFVACAFATVDQQNIMQLRRLQQLFQNGGATLEQNVRALKELGDFAKDEHETIVADYVKVGRTYQGMYWSAKIATELAAYHICILNNQIEERRNNDASGIATDENNSFSNAQQQCQSETQQLLQTTNKALQNLEQYTQQPSQPSSGSESTRY
eukprot:CAMPEP_0117451994 /NCGR_PEP_ID=MMETSP0759-20121206/9335_1 /TAXON_ID=63605 /ORGANISM="Percolomonas cosmopolitus, Strain WS" /LENGTH=162 /DNA_ID=CAMNT_0005244693 /DNA_START=383 /DNA_END=871 /DNA_ORIENTATION=+